MLKKRFLRVTTVFLALSIFIALFSAAANAACCITSQVGQLIDCQQMLPQQTQQDCEDGGGEYNADDCTAIEECAEDCTTGDTINYECLDGTTITTAECIGGDFYATGEVCPEEAGPADTCANDELDDDDETDVDCGGACDPCALGMSCEADSDCQSGNCSAGICEEAAVPEEPECSDGEDNDGDELIDDNDPGCYTLEEYDPQDDDESDEAPPEELPVEVTKCGNGVCDLEEDEESCVYDCGFCGDGQLVNEECEDDSDCFGGSCSNCECIYNCLESPPAPGNLVASNIQGEDSVSVSWTLDPSGSGCSLNEIMIYRCSRSPLQEQCEPEEYIASVPERALSLYSYTDSDDIMPGITYCYQARAYYKDYGSISESNLGCTSYANERACMEGNNFFCKNNILYSCGARNERSEVQNCSAIPTDEGAYYCLGPDSSGNAECVFQNSCDLCNGLFGIFGIYGTTIHPLQTGSGTVRTENVLCTEEFVKACYFDSTKTNVDKYWYCANVTSCYDYISDQSCNDNICGIGECIWSESDDAGAEFGVGACVPADNEKQDCSVCDTQSLPARNELFGACSDEVCRLYGDCYYTNVLGGFECVSEDSIGCRAYLTEDDCIGSQNEGRQNVTVDATYDQGKRTGGTNEITSESNDYLGFGTCRWSGEFGANQCVKDADGDVKADCDYYEWECQADNTPPETKIKQDVPVQNNRLLLGTDVFLEVETTEPAITYFCFVKDEGSDPGCYPTESTACAIQKKISADEGWFSGPGDYILYYYSEDSAHNLEQVKSIDVSIDDSVPDIAVSVSDPVPRTKTVTIGSDSEAVCNADLKDSVGNVVYPELSIQEQVIAAGNSISRTYTDLADDDYYFTYSCRNRAGNIQEGERIIELDTNRIHNPDPSYPVSSASVMISVTTEVSAECRYALTTGTDQRFDDMENSFSTENSLDHESRVLVAPGDYYSYDVKCRFGDGSIEGAKNDRIRFAVDNVPPTVKAVSTFAAYGFDQSQEYGEKQTLMLECRDDWFLKNWGVRGMDFGCERTTYSYTDRNGYLVQDMTFDGEGLSDPFTVSSTQVINYRTEDKGGNYVTGGISVNINTAPPILSLDMMKPPVTEDSVSLDAVASGDYILRLSSTKSISLAQADIKIFGDDQVYNIDTAKAGTEDFGRVHYFSFSIPWTLPEMTDNVLVANVTARVARPGEFCSLDFSTSTNRHYTARNFTFDTGFPEIDLKPRLSSYDSSQYLYPLNEEDDVYYTNANPLFITGESKGTSTARVNYYIGKKLSEMRIQQVYDMDDNADYEPISEMDSAQMQGSAGDTTLISYFGGLEDFGVTEGNYIEFEHTRKDYGHYKNYYAISGVSGSRIMLEEPLEEDVELTDDAAVYNRKTPYNWFGADVELERGINYLFLRPESRAGLEGSMAEDEIFTIVYDPDAPEVMEQTPAPGSNENTEMPISIIVREPVRSSQLDTGSVKLYLNDESVSLEDITVTTNGKYNYYNITHLADGLDGTYYVNFTGHDFALNPISPGSASPSWVFTVNEDSPQKPIFDVAGGTKHNGMWFVRESPEFTLYFPDDVPVEITAYFKNYIENYVNVENCRGRADTNFFTDCYFDPELEPRSIGSGGEFLEDVFQIIVQARKVFGENALGPNSPIYLDKLVIDDLEPNIGTVTYPEKMGQNQIIEFDAIVYNEAHDLNATLFFMGEAHDLTQTGRSDNHYYFEWDSPAVDFSIPAQREEFEGMHDITLNIADYAGNSDSFSGEMFMDLSYPDVEDLSVTVTPTKVISYREYKTRQTEVLIKGNFTDDDVTSVYVVPGSYRFIPGEEPEREDISELANIIGNSFELTMIINGTFNKTILNELSIFMEDEAGNTASTILSVVADLQPPYVVGTTVS
ncbi:hypothetical protein GF345_00395 [Candidatus Woesearchaeota archaeon]|nr:hypothetical protein [Candidatus Woesearchaeota archaeon]